jgi:alanyl-tRNA synthetase
LNDPTLLFTNAGMNQFKPIFLGQAQPGTELATLERACNSQKCIRAGGKHNDLEDVGVDTYHHTFFEMLGSWSFGDYFKEDAVSWARELLVDVYGLDPDRLYATYFEGAPDEGLEPDLEARDLWIKAGFAPERVLPGSKADNFWEMGDSGPCGPCTELHYDCLGGRDAASLVNMDDPTVIEIWNVVFIQFNRDGRTKELSLLPDKHVDTGMGLERLVAILQKKPSNYDTDVFAPLFEATRLELPEGAAAYAGLLGEADKAQGLRDTAYRAVADHVRCLSFAIADGAVPSNEGRGYVLRRILRRAVRWGTQTLGAKSGFLSRLAPALANSGYGEAYPELLTELPRIVEVLAEEEASFAKTLERGIAYLEEELTMLSESKPLPGSAAFFLYDSLGFPLDLTELMAAEKGVKVDAEGFEAEMAAQVARSREDRAARAAEALGSTAIVLGAAETAELGNELAPTMTKAVGATPSDDGLEIQDTEVVALFRATPAGIERIMEADLSQGPVGVVLKETPFFAEGGGQVADKGTLIVEGADLKVMDVQRYAGYILHTVDGSGSNVKVGAKASGKVDVDTRLKNSINHTMTHTLNWALWTVLGEGVGQRGADTATDRLRFDFSHGKALKPEEIEQTEALVNRVIEDKFPVRRQLVPLDQAMAISSLRAVFGETYPDPVQVVAIGLDADTSIDDVLAEPEADRWRSASIELCGGTHATSSADAGSFVITTEGAVAKGVRRIEAVTFNAAADARALGAELMGEAEKLAAEDFGKDPAGVAERAKKLRARVDSATCSAALKPRLRATLDDGATTLTSLDTAKAAAAGAEAADRVMEEAAAAADAGKQTLILELPVGVDGKSMGKLAKKLAKQYPNLALLAVAGGDADKLAVFAHVPDGHPVGPASGWLNAALAPVGGRGGGKPSFAQGSANNDGGGGASVVEAAEAFVKV